MRRSALNFVIDAVSLAAMLGLIATGLIVRYILPAGSGGRGRGAAQSLWGLTRHEWGDVHFWLAVGVVALLIIHLALHWTWTCVLVRRWVAPGKPPLPRLGSWRRHAYGVGLLASVALFLAAFTWIACASVETPRDDRSTPGHARRRGAAVSVHDAGPPARRESEGTKRRRRGGTGGA